MDKYVLITGCNSGIGSATAKLFLQEGWEVLATIYPGANYNELANIDSKSLHLLPLDIREPDDIVRVGNYIKDNFSSKLDCLVNNAGIRHQMPFEKLTFGQIQDCININLTGLCLITRECMPYLMKSSGRIICISSVAGFIPIPMGSVYSACKHALEGFVQSLAMELKTDNVQICSIQPGAHDTPINHVSDYDDISCDKTKKASDMAKCLARLNKPPAHNVAKAITEAVKMHKMPLSIKVGNDAKLHHLINLVLPRRIWLKLHRYILSLCALNI